MGKTRIYEAYTQHLQLLDKDGQLDADFDRILSDKQIVDLYEKMVWVRSFDDKAVKLQRQGRMGTWASLKGQEAAQVGVALAMADDDWLVPSFREHGLLLARGVPGHRIYAYWRGDERASVFDDTPRILPPSIPVGSQLVHGAGLGYGVELRGGKDAVVACAGDGATSEGDFHEALNFAAVFGSRTVFFIQNNGYAISMPVKRQTASASLAQKAHAYGMPGIRVDGNDPLAVYAAVAEALERARNGGGPTLIEALTYRLGDHTTSDEASRYRRAEELAYWAERDPLLRTRKYLKSRDLWDEQKEERCLTGANERVNREVKLLEEMNPQDPEEMFDSMYSELPLNLKRQREALLAEVSNG